jgi:hypothetical protein
LAITPVGTLTADTSTANAASYDTASVTLTAGRLYIIGIFSQDNSAPEEDPTSVVTVGGAVTFTKKVSRSFTSARVVSAWEARPGSTVTAAIRITLNDAGVGCSWIVREYTGHDATTPVPQTTSNQANAATLAATLGALVNTGSYQLAFEAVEGTAADQTVSGTDWSEVDNDILPSVPSARFAAAENASGVAQQVTFSGGTQDRAMVVVEIAAAALSTAAAADGASTASVTAAARRGCVASVIAAAAVSAVLSVGGFKNGTAAPAGRATVSASAGARRGLTFGTAQGQASATPMPTRYMTVPVIAFRFVSGDGLNATQANADGVAAVAVTITSRRTMAATPVGQATVTAGLSAKRALTTSTPASASVSANLQRISRTTGIAQTSGGSTSTVTAAAIRGNLTSTGGQAVTSVVLNIRKNLNASPAGIASTEATLAPGFRNTSVATGGSSTVVAVGRNNEAPDLDGLFAAEHAIALQMIREIGG